MGKNGLDFRGKQKPAANLPVEQGLDTHPVPGQKQPLSRLFPHGEGENAVHFVKGIFPPLGIGVEDYLRIGVGMEAVAQLLKGLPQLCGIVELPIIDKGVAFAPEAQGHRLRPARGVDDGKSGMQQRTAGKPQAAPTVRPPAGHGFQHCFFNRFSDFQAHTAGYGTHKNHTPLSVYAESQKGCMNPASRRILAGR